MIKDESQKYKRWETDGRWMRKNMSRMTNGRLKMYDNLWKYKWWKMIDDGLETKNKI